MGCPALPCNKQPTPSHAESTFPASEKSLCSPFGLCSWRDRAQRLTRLHTVDDLGWAIQGLSGAASAVDTGPSGSQGRLENLRIVRGLDSCITTIHGQHPQEVRTQPPWRKLAHMMSLVGPMTIAPSHLLAIREWIDGPSLT